jgi:hypothetical protein
MSVERGHEIDETEIARQEAEKAQRESLTDLQADAGLNELISGKKPESVVGPEQQEIHKSPETITEKEPGSGIRPSHDQPADTKIAGDAQDTQNLNAALKTLEDSDSGKPIARAIQDNQTAVCFGKTGEDAIAQFDSSTNTITIHESQRDANPDVLAAHLAHEGTHVQLKDTAYPVNEGVEKFEEAYVEEEYQAFRAQAETWNQVKGDESDEQCDAVSAMIARGEADAKDQIRQMYGDAIREAYEHARH